LVFTDLVGAHEHAPVAALLRHESQADSGVSARGLDNRAAGAQQTLSLSGVDNTLGDAVFRRPPGVHVLELDEHCGGASVGHPVELDERSVADDVEYRIGDSHWRKSTSAHDRVSWQVVVAPRGS